MSDFISSPPFCRPNYPFQTSWWIDPKSKKIVLTIEAPKEWADKILCTLKLLDALALDLRRRAEEAERRVRIDARLDERDRVWRQVYVRYEELRQAGVKHRAAICLLCTEPEWKLTSWTAGWDFPQFNRCIRTMLNQELSADPKVRKLKP